LLINIVLVGVYAWELKKSERLLEEQEELKKALDIVKDGLHGR
jgi:Flp pilus assembly protein TadB